MREQYAEFDTELLKNDFLRRHSECLPFIGEEYKNTRLLLVGESHYVPEVDVHCVNRDDFYEVSFEDLDDGKYRGWISTRKVFEYRVYDRGDFKNFFSNPATEIAKVIKCIDNPTLEQRVEAMHQYAFMNYFKRPSYDRGKTILGLTDKDYKYAYEISRWIIEILKPKMIIFLSRKAYYSFCDWDKEGEIATKYIIKSVSHPSSIWWNRRRKDGRCAREDFYDYISTVL